MLTSIRRVALLLASLSLSTAALAGVDPPAAVAATEPAPLTCLGVSQERKDQGLSILTANECSVAVKCSFSWSLQCGSGDKKKAPHAEHRQITVAAGEKQSVEASASACGTDDWDIATPSYDCKPVK